MLPFKITSMITRNRLKDLQIYINDIFENPQVFNCYKCQEKSAYLIYEVNEVLIIESQYLFHNKIINSQCPTSITVKNIIYNIIGIIEIIEGSPESTNHYRAHCFYNDEWKIKDGLAKTFKTNILSESLKVSLMIYAKL